MRTLIVLILLTGAAAQALPVLEPTVAREDRILAEMAEHPEEVRPLLAPAGLRDWDNWKINSDTTVELQNEEQVAVNPLDPDNVVAVWRDFRLGYRRVGVGYSFDGGLTWTDSLLEHPLYPWHSDPGITWDRFGNFYVVILSYVNTSQPNGLFVLKSTDGGVTWGDAVAAVDGVPGVFEDKELIACDRSGGLNDGNVYVAWARFYDTHIYNVRSTDGAQSFDTPIRISDHGGVQWPVPMVDGDGVLYVAWVDYGGYIRMDRSFDGGVTFGSDITISSIDTPSLDLNGGIRTFSFPAMDCDQFGGVHDGRLYVAYMDRQGSDFDIYLRYSDNQGLSWTSPLRINDDTLSNGRDQFHPWIAVSPDGVVSVIFYDRRNDPANYMMDLYLAQSFDGGLSFEANQRVTTVSSDPNAGSRAGLIGEYIGLAASSASRVHPVWTDTREGNQDAYTSVVGTATAVDEEFGQAGLRITGISPNPFRDETSIAYSTGQDEYVFARVYDVEGRLVREMCGGNGQLSWDGRDSGGSLLGSGVYFIRVTSSSETATGRILILR